MNFTADFSNYKDRFGGYVAPGRYLATIEDAEGDTSKAGNQMIRLSLRIRSAGDYQNTTLIDLFTLTDKAIFRLVNFLEILTGKPVPRKALSLNTDAWLNKQIAVEVEDREYNGRTSSSVAAYLKPSILLGDSPDTTEDLPEYAPEPASGVVDSPAPEVAPAPVAPAPAPAPVAAAPAPAPSVDEVTGEVDLDTLDL